MTELFELDAETVRRVLAAVTEQMLTRSFGPASIARIARDFGVDND